MGQAKSCMHRWKTEDEDPSSSTAHTATPSSPVVENSWFQTSEISSLDEDFSSNEEAFSLEQRSIIKTSEEIEEEGNLSIDQGSSKTRSEKFEDESYYYYSLEEQGINKRIEEEIQAIEFSLHPGRSTESIEGTEFFVMMKQEGESHEGKPKAGHWIEPAKACAKSSSHGQKITDKGCPVVAPRTCVEGQGPHVSKNMNKAVICAANVRQRGGAAIEDKSCQLLISKNTPDKEQQLEELMNLRIALANQCYHSKLHKFHLTSLQAKQQELEKRIVDLEELNGYEAPRTGGEARLNTKIAGLQAQLEELEASNVSRMQELCKLRAKFQVCCTHEVLVERQTFGGEVLRQQKLVQKYTKLTKLMKGHNKRYLDLKNNFIPKFEKSIEDNNEFILSARKRMESNELNIEIFKAQIQEEVDSTKARATKISKMAQQAKALLNQLKDVRTAKRKTLQEIWGLDSETRFYLKEKRVKNKSKAK